MDVFSLLWDCHIFAFISFLFSSLTVPHIVKRNTAACLQHMCLCMNVLLMYCWQQISSVKLKMWRYIKSLLTNRHILKKAHTHDFIPCLFQTLISDYQAHRWIGICWWHSAASVRCTVVESIKDWRWQELHSDFICLCLCASSGSSEGEPQEEGDGGEDQESQAGEGESRAREAGAPAEEEAADWHEQRYATSLHAATETGEEDGGVQGDKSMRVEGGFHGIFTLIWTER